MTTIEAWDDDHSGPAPTISVTVDAGWDGFGHVLSKIAGCYVVVTTRDGTVTEGQIDRVDFGGDEPVLLLIRVEPLGSPDKRIEVVDILSVVYL